MDPKIVSKQKFIDYIEKRFWLTVMNVLLFSHVINNVHGTKYVIILSWFEYNMVFNLTLVLLNPDIPCFANSVDPDQLASEEAN